MYYFPNELFEFCFISSCILFLNELFEFCFVSNAPAVLTNSHNIKNILIREQNGQSTYAIAICAIL